MKRDTKWGSGELFPFFPIFVSASSLFILSFVLQVFFVPLSLFFILHSQILPVTWLKNVTTGAFVAFWPVRVLISDHTTTRSREVDEQLATLNDHHDSVLSRLDTLCTTVQQHSKNFEVLQKSIASQQAVIANMMVKFSKLDKPSTIPPLLDKP